MAPSIDIPSTTMASSAHLTAPASFVGLGAMGQGMAINLAKKGVPLRVFDLRPEAMQAIEPYGGKPTSSMQEATKGVDTLILMVINEAQARQVLFEQGALEATNAGALVILMSTISPAASAAIGQLVERAGRSYVDAPVSGGMKGANTGTLTIMAGARKEVYARAEPYLRCMGTKLFHVGEEAGKGQSMKAVNQVLCAVHLVAAAEALSFAKKAGIDPAMALELTSESAASSWFLRDRGERMLVDDAPVASAVQIIRKDAGLVVDAGREIGAALPLTANALQIMNSAHGCGHALLDDSQLIRIYDTLNGVRPSSQ